MSGPDVDEDPVPAVVMLMGRMHGDAQDFAHALERFALQHGFVFTPLVHVLPPELSAELIDGLA